MTRPFDRELAIRGPQPYASAAQPATAAPPVPEREQRLVVIRLPEEIDITNEDQVLGMLTRPLRAGTAVLVADGTATTFCGCAGVNALIRTHRQAAVTGTRLRVAASPAMRRVLDLTGTHHKLDSYPTLAAAMADGRSPEEPPGVFG